MNDDDIIRDALSCADSDERSRILDAAAGGDPERRRQLQAKMIDAGLASSDGYEQTGMSAPLDAMTPATHATAASFVPRSADEIGAGARFGNYKLLQKLGEGGMGAVWMAKQDKPVQRNVALKLIRAGLENERVLARFEAERQALALMDHPNIARVYDAGVGEGGQPYFVMELVNGVPVTKYCDDHKLDIKARLELFIPICQALQHAHQKGIIHRDIKPSNIIVGNYDGRAVPKVIDFGVAKAMGQKLTDKTMFTEFGAVVGTLEYMSPEQAEVNALDIDTRSDVYSLGVLLYELLTGSTPLGRETLQKAAFLEVLRRIKEEEPPRPSTRLSDSKESLPSTSAMRSAEPARLPAQIRGDLDWIVMKALAKERDRRYGTASNFAIDVERYLTDQPIEARPPSAAYKTRKFVRRHRTGVIAGGLALVTLIAATIFSSWMAVKATRAETEATTQRDAAKEAARAEKEQRDIAVVERDNANSANQIAQNTLTFFQDKVLKAPRKAGTDVRGVTALGPDVKVSDALDVAAKYTGEDFKKFPLYEASVRLVLGTTYHDLSLYTKAAEQHKRTWDLRKEHAKRGPDHDETLRAAVNYALSLADSGHPKDAIPIYEDAIARRKKRIADATAQNLSPIQTRREAIELYTAQNNLAQAYAADKNPEQSVKVLEAAAETCRSALGSDHPNTLMFMINLAVELRNLGRKNDALVLADEVVAIRNRVLGPNDMYTLWARHIRGTALAETGKVDAGIAEMEEVTPALVKIMKADNNELLKMDLMRARTYRTAGKMDKALELARDVVARRAGKAMGNAEDHSAAIEELASILVDTGKFAEAEKILEGLLDDRTKRNDAAWQIADVNSVLGAARSGLKKPDAEALLKASYATVKAADKLPPSLRESRLAAAARRLANHYQSLGKTVEATEWKKIAVGHQSR